MADLPPIKVQGTGLANGFAGTVNTKYNMLSSHNGFSESLVFVISLKFEKNTEKFNYSIRFKVTFKY